MEAMNNKRKGTLFILLLVLIFGLSAVSYAENNAFSKLGRGAANTLTGWLEIPKNIYEVSTARNPLMGISWGLIKGLGWGIARTSVGLYEVATFPFPIPKDYGPIIRPDFVIGTE